MLVQLAPCPFCGGNNITINVLLPPFRAYCKDCGAEGPDSTISAEMALLYWNTAGCPGRLTWTKTRPTEPGFYFYKNKKGNVKIVKYEFSLIWGAYRTTPHDHALYDKEALWAGPIPKPEEMEDAK